MVDKPFSVIDLFCGAGGLSLGFRDAGFDLILAVDFNEAAIATHEANFTGAAMWADVTKGIGLPAATVVVGGPPCQGFSSAGLRQSGDGRNTLVGWYAKTIAKLRPRAFVFENVEGFLTAEDGSRVFELLSPVIEAGYYVHLRKVNAANYGVPQHRKRVLAIGGLGWAPTFPEPTHSAFGAPGAHRAVRHMPLSPTLGDAIATLPEAASAPPGDPEDHYVIPLSDVDLARAAALGQGQTMRDLPTELQHESYRRRAFRRVMDGTPSERRGGAPAGMRRLVLDAPSKAITGAARNEFLHPTQDRTLTLRECARIQTFPDTFRFLGTVAERMQLIGNAVPPALALIIASSLARDLRSAVDITGPGRLVTFIPTVSSGMSPALERLVADVRRRYLSNPAPGSEQLPLWG